MTLSDALTYVYGSGVRWDNPIRPYFIPGISQTPYEAYCQLGPEFQRIVKNMIGHEPRKGEV